MEVCRRDALCPVQTLMDKYCIFKLLPVCRGVTCLCSCIISVVKGLELGQCDNAIVQRLSPGIKNKLIHLMTKRGCLCDKSAAVLLNKYLKVLDLVECDVTDTTLTSVASQCPNLVKLDLNAAKNNRSAITPAGLSSVFSSCRHLQVVYLRRCVNVTDACLRVLATSCRNIRDLNLGGCSLVTDSTLAALGEHSSRLRSLNFSHTQATDSGVLSLVSGAPAESLEELHMNHCVRLTDEAVEAAVEGCPRLTILLFHGCPLLTDASRVALEQLASSGKTLKQVTWTIY